MKKTSKKKSPKPTSDVYKDYNTKRVRLCEFSVSAELAKTVKPALERLAAHHGGKVPAIADAILQADKRLQRKMKK